MSDHRPVTAVYDIEVEVFSPRKLQRALTFTDAELENEDVLIDKGLSAAMNHLQQEGVSIVYFKCVNWLFVCTMLWFSVG